MWLGFVGVCQAANTFTALPPVDLNNYARLSEWQQGRGS
jgi:hypothetical protein